MNVVHITNNDSYGGASKAAFRLHEAMLKFGINSSFLVFHKKKKDLTVISPFSFFDKLKLSFYIRLEKLLLRKYEITSTFSYAKYGFSISNLKILKTADVVYIHWINAGMLNIKSIVKILKLGKPVYYFMHDMWPLTGGCHHAFDCKKYQTHCSKCLILNSTRYNDPSYKLHEKKLREFSTFSNFYAISPSSWLGECAKKSIIFKKKKVFIIPNLLNTEIFTPLNKIKLRNKYNLPIHKKIILFAAIAGTNNIYKGWSYLVESIKQIDPEKCEIVILGSSHSENVTNEISLKSHLLGHISSEEMLAEIYSTADVFVAPSLADNFPNTIVESMACGTPVVGFNIGGIPDLIKHKHNGYLSTYKSSQDLANGINWVLFQKKHNLSKNARQYIVENYSYKKLLSYHFFLKRKQND